MTFSIYLYTLSILSTIGMIFLDNLFWWAYWWEPSQKSLQQFPHSYFSDWFLRFHLIKTIICNVSLLFIIWHFFKPIDYFKLGFGFGLFLTNFYYSRFWSDQTIIGNISFFIKIGNENTALYTNFRLKYW